MSNAHVSTCAKATFDSEQQRPSISSKQTSPHRSRKSLLHIGASQVETGANYSELISHLLRCTSNHISAPTKNHPFQVLAVCLPLRYVCQDNQRRGSEKETSAALKQLPDVSCYRAVFGHSMSAETNLRSKQCLVSILIQNGDPKPFCSENGDLQLDRFGSKTYFAAQV